MTGMSMRVFTFSLLVCPAAGSAADLSTRHTENLANTLLDRALLSRWPTSHGELDHTTLAKAPTVAGRGAPYTRARLDGAVPFRSSARRAALRPQVPIIASNARAVMRSPSTELEHRAEVVARSSVNAGNGYDAALTGLFVQDVALALKEQFIQQYLPIALTVAIAFGMNFPEAGKQLAAIKFGGVSVVQTFCVFYVFFIQGASLKMDELRKALTAVKPFLYGVFTVSFLTPFISIPVNWLTWMQQDLRTGFVLFYNMATTKCGVQLVAQGKGNFAFALMLTAVTNILSVFTVPVFLAQLMSGSGSVAIDAVKMTRELFATILVPVLMGNAAAKIPPVANFLNKNKRRITISTSTALATVPMIKIAQSAGTILQMGAGPILQVGALATGVHVVLLIWNYIFTGLLRFPLEFRKALIILGSQKTLPIAMAVLSLLPETIGNLGTIAIPCIIGHFSQLIMDSFVVARMAQWNEAPGNSTAVADTGPAKA